MHTSYQGARVGQVQAKRLFKRPLELGGEFQMYNIPRDGPPKCWNPYKNLEASALSRSPREANLRPRPAASELVLDRKQLGHSTLDAPAERSVRIIAGRYGFSAA